MTTTNLFNYESQKLSAEELRQLNSFNSYNFAGVVGDGSNVEIETDENFGIYLNVSEDDPAIFLGGGLLLSQTEPVRILLSDNHAMVYMKVILDTDTGTIVTDKYDGITFETTTCDHISFNKPYTLYGVIDEIDSETDPHESQYYEYSDGTYSLTDDTVINEDKTYYSKYENSKFSFRSKIGLGNIIYTYNGNTIWINNNTFIIPLAIREGQEIKKIVCARNLKDFTDYLSLEAYAKLKAYCEGKFVWSEGGEELVLDPETGKYHMKGDVGELNIKGNRIRSRKTTKYDDTDMDYVDPVEITKLNLLNLKDSSDSDKLVADKDGNIKSIKDYKTPVGLGGTYVEGSWNEINPRYSAKFNLGISYGTQNPSVTYPFSPAKEGDIYLKIIE